MEPTTRRSFISTTGKAAAALALVNAALPAFAKGMDKRDQYYIPFTQTPLGFNYNALEPYIDAQTMELHYTKHAATYAKNLGEAAAAEKVNIANTTLETVLKSISKYSAKMRNNAGGHYNHELFWKTLKLNEKGMPQGLLAAAITKSFGSFEMFKDKFAAAAKDRFGSGWAWLVLKKDGKLVVTSTANQDNPLMNVAQEQGFPVLGLDVWEHAYYLKYQNKRPDYINSFWNVINWQWIGERYEAQL